MQQQVKSDDDWNKRNHDNMIRSIKDESAHRENNQNDNISISIDTDGLKSEFRACLDFSEGSECSSSVRHPLFPIPEERKKGV